MITIYKEVNNLGEKKPENSRFLLFALSKVEMNVLPPEQLLMTQYDFLHCRVYSEFIHLFTYVKKYKFSRGDSKSCSVLLICSPFQSCVMISHFIICEFFFLSNMEFLLYY